MINLNITGVKEIDNVLKQMPLQLTDRVLSAAGVQSAKPLIDREKALAPEGPNGHLVDSIGAVRSAFRNVSAGNREVGEVIVGPRRRKGRYYGFHAHLVEYGTKKRATKGRGKYRAGSNRGVMPKKPFVLPAFTQTKNAVLGIYGQEVGKKLYQFMRRTLKQ